MDCILSTVLRRAKLKKEINYELMSRYLKRFYKITLEKEVYEKRIKEIVK